LLVLKRSCETWKERGEWRKDEDLVVKRGVFYAEGVHCMYSR
jgi:hypothetical protein